MTNEHFYDIIDSEIDKLVNVFKNNEFLIKQDENGKKSFGFLLWFLQKYLPKVDLSDLEHFIVEGEDDNSCDLIFENKDNQGDLIFYVVQAKWFKKSNIKSSNKLSRDLKACLSDFKVILSGRKEPSSQNQQFNIRYEKFIEHKKRNGKVKFIFLGLCQEIDGVQDNINEFTTSLVRFEKYDIFKLKKQYIELTFKGIKTHNPIETPYIPKSKIELGIVPQKFIHIPKPAPFQSYIFLVKPSEIFKLFENFGLSIFYKNIRNPLPKSFYNEKIGETVKDNPLNFWYFNNGITAITDEIGDFHADSEYVAIKGIQVINGAQTVYSIYSTYLEASEDERLKMDSDTFISMRILRTGGEDFDLLVTKFTNSQNPIDERDFHSNDSVQKRLQDDFIRHTNIWYETRRGEFISKTKYARIISNESFGQAYLAYYLQDPFSAKTKKRMIFLTEKENKEGLYDKIYNDQTSYIDLLLSKYIFLFVDRRRKEYTKSLVALEPNEFGEFTIEQKNTLKFDFLQYATFEIVALYKIILFESLGEEKKPEFTNKLVSQYEREDYSKFLECYQLITDCLEILISSKKQTDAKFVLSVYFKNRQSYSELKNQIVSNLTSMSLQI